VLDKALDRDDDSKKVIPIRLRRGRSTLPRHRCAL